MIPKNKNYSKEYCSAHFQSASFFSMLWVSANELMLRNNAGIGLLIFWIISDFENEFMRKFLVILLNIFENFIQKRKIYGNIPYYLNVLVIISTKVEHVH